jgi:hypothetical protein
MKEFLEKARVIIDLARHHTLGSAIETLTQRDLARRDAAPFAPRPS